MSNLWGSLTPCSRVGPHCRHSLSRLQRLRVGKLVNNVSVVCSCVFGWGRVGEGSRHWSALMCILWDFALCICTRVWLCTHGILYYRPQHPIFRPSPPPYSETPTPLLHQAYLCPAVHSCEKQRSAERDICSVRECPNYSWPFNHSGFGLRGICGVSHKCASDTLVNGSFITVVLCSVPPN